jgi:hypothetical protein
MCVTSGLPVIQESSGESITNHKLTSQYLSIVQEVHARLQKLTIDNPVRVDHPSFKRVSLIPHGRAIAEALLHLNIGQSRHFGRPIRLGIRSVRPAALARRGSA